jgi:hypothetical protein
MQGFSDFRPANKTFINEPFAKFHDLFSDDFGFKINRLVCNLAHIFILRRPLIIIFKNIIYLEGILHFRRWIIIFKNIIYLEGILHFRRWKPWKLGVNHPTIGISQKVHLRVVRRSATGHTKPRPVASKVK